MSTSARSTAAVRAVARARSASSDTDVGGPRELRRQVQWWMERDERARAKHVFVVVVQADGRITGGRASFEVSSKAR